MLEKLTIETFQDLLGETFELFVPPDNEVFDLKLLEASNVGGNKLDRDPFSVVFTGPEEPVLLQAIYRVKHSTLGELDLFLVPIGPGQDGMKYEAVFT